VFAYHEDLELTLAHNHLPVILESDYSRFILASQEKKKDKSPYLHIISNIKLLPSNSLQVCKSGPFNRASLLFGSVQALMF
jgi:hypothetical protein